MTSLPCPTCGKEITTEKQFLILATDAVGRIKCPHCGAMAQVEHECDMGHPDEPYCEEWLTKDGAP